MAKAVAKKYAREGWNLYLAARNSSELSDFARDIQVRTDKDVQLLELDVLDFESHERFYDSLTVKPQALVCAVGYMPEQELTQHNFSEFLQVTNSNYVGIASLLNIVSNDFEQQKQGCIIGISSVAGDRGRKTNYSYGAAKAAFTSYLSGLRNRLFNVNVHVMTVKPGFVYTQMTENMELPKPLTAKPEQVANAIYKAHDKYKDVLYVLPVWQLIMLIIKLIPEKIFKRLSI